MKIQVKLILNCTRALAITCLSHAGQNYVQRTTFKILRSRKQVCRFVIKEQGIVVARGKPAKIVSKKQQVHSLKAISLQTNLK